MNNDERFTVNNLIEANLPDEISVEDKLKRIKIIDKEFLSKYESDRFLILKPYDRESDSFYITLFLNLEKSSDVFKFLEKYVGKIQLIDTSFDDENKVDFWIGGICYSLVSADFFTVDVKEGI